MTGRYTYFIQCHENSDRLKLLFRSIYRPDSLIFIHCDRKSPKELHDVAERLATHFENVSVINSRWVAWGGFSQVEILVDALEAALGSNKEWDHFILLSEHHVTVRPPAEFNSIVARGVSYFSSLPYEQIGAGKLDIDHRFSAEWRELSAWGMFPLGRELRHEWVWQNIHHGSNWVVLCREHCMTVVNAVATRHGVVEHLKRSVQPDEMFVQTVLASAAIEAASHINRDLTYVAWPTVSGTNDLTFIENNYFDARDNGYLFIRKAPKIIPVAVMNSVNSFAAFSSTELDDLIDCVETSEARLLSSQVRVETRRLKFTTVDIAENPPFFCPKFYLKFTRADLPADIFVALISEDLIDFKLLVCWRHQEEDALAYKEVAGFETHVLKARVADLIFNREIIVPDDPRHGFFSKAEFPSAAEIAAYASTYIEFAKKFSEQQKCV